MKTLIFLALLITTLAFVHCSNQESTQPLVYTGPLREAEDVKLVYTEKEQIKVKMDAKKIFEFQNGDREFPEGIYLEFYDEFGKLKSTLRANQAYYFKSENRWRGRGKVEVRNMDKGEQLNTEELFWKPDTKKIFTEKFVTIKLENEILYGTGLDAAQDLSYYTIANPKGEFDVKE